MTKAVASPPDIGRAAAIFEAWIGFDIAEAAPRRLMEFLVARASHLGYPSVAAYLDDLPNERPRTAEAQRLINVATNGLTAFWRDEPQLEALGDMMEARFAVHERPLRIWSAGCSTGEEPYSVAIVAAERGVPVEVLGTDVNTDYLEAARRREYDDWSLRRLSEERKRRWFDSSGPRHLLDRAVARPVDFRHHNLLDPPARADGAWDFILCRNVLIYLTAEARRRILEGFVTTLADDGLLFVGPSEQVASPDLGLGLRRVGGAFALGQKTASESLTTPQPPPARSLDEKTADFTDEDAVLRLLRAGVGHDDPDSALACFEAAAGYDPFTPETHALLGDFLETAGASTRARDAFGKVLFIDPRNWWAAVRIARLHESSGNRVESRRYWTIALDALQKSDRPTFHRSLAIGVLGEVDERHDEFRDEIVDAVGRLG